MISRLTASSIDTRAADTRAAKYGAATLRPELPIEPTDIAAWCAVGEMIAATMWRLTPHLPPTYDSAPARAVRQIECESRANQRREVLVDAHRCGGRPKYLARDLPEALTRLVLAQLDQYAAATVVCRVCRHWRAVVYGQPAHWQRLAVRCPTRVFTVPVVEALIRRAGRGLGELVVDGCHLGDGSVGAGKSDGLARLIAALDQQLPMMRLQHLSIRCCGFKTLLGSAPAASMLIAFAGRSRLALLTVDDACKSSYMRAMLTQIAATETEIDGHRPRPRAHCRHCRIQAAASHTPEAALAALDDKLAMSRECKVCGSISCALCEQRVRAPNCTWCRDGVVDALALNGRAGSA